MSRRIARAIVAARPLRTTLELADLVARAVRRRGRIHPATRTFQALRIATNDELGVIARALAQAVDLLAPLGRLAVISFHSVEDRLVKQYFRAISGRSVRWIARRPVIPSEAERQRNPRSRSAKLRIVEKLAPLG